MNGRGMLNRLKHKAVNKQKNKVKRKYGWKNILKRKARRASNKMINKTINKLWIDLPLSMSVTRNTSPNEMQKIDDVEVVSSYFWFSVSVSALLLYHLFRSAVASQLQIYQIAKLFCNVILRIMFRCFTLSFFIVTFCFFNVLTIKVEPW